jgi:hypothetical protein
MAPIPSVKIVAPSSTTAMAQAASAYSSMLRLKLSASFACAVANGCRSRTTSHTTNAATAPAMPADQLVRNAAPIAARCAPAAQLRALASDSPVVPAWKPRTSFMSPSSRGSPPDCAPEPPAQDHHRAKDRMRHAPEATQRTAGAAARGAKRRPPARAGGLRVQRGSRSIT